MDNYTPHQARYFAEQITVKRSESSVDGLASAMSGVKVDLNPHQVDAALFAIKSPLSNGALLADEVGLGKTIEAGLVLAQYWSERKRRILLIVPASLRMQWRAELSEKFYIESVIMESANFNKEQKAGKINPFEAKNRVVICSYNFASRKALEIRRVDWDLVIMDEAHKLRNVYKPNNVTGNKLKIALGGRKKLLLTATPLQNNLMELYGLASIIDDHVFGDAKTFREMYVAISNPDVRNRSLRARMQPFCKRTLRSQVSEYVKYTERIAILQEYAPTPDEEKLYNDISDYLQTDKLYALPEGQRNLITMVLRKLLASSSFAIRGTLESLISRLEALLQGIEQELDMEDFDYFSTNNWVMVKHSNTDDYYASFTGACEYFTGDSITRYLEGHIGERPQLVYQAEHTEWVEPGVYSLNCIVRADDRGAFVYTQVDGEKQLKEIPPYGDKGGELWLGITKALKENGKDLQELKAEPQWKQDEWHKIAKANHSRGFGWSIVHIDDIIVTADSIPIVYGVSTVPEFTGQPCRAKWFSATDFELTRTGDLPKQKK